MEVIIFILACYHKATIMAFWPQTVNTIAIWLYQLQCNTMITPLLVTTVNLLRNMSKLSTEAVVNVLLEILSWIFDFVKP